MNKVKYLVVEINEDDKTFHFLNEYEDEQTAKNMLNLYSVKAFAKSPYIKFLIFTLIKLFGLILIASFVSLFYFCVNTQYLPEVLMHTNICHQLFVQLFYLLLRVLRQAL